MTPEERRQFNEEWVERLHKGGWICASWPTEFEGKGLSTLEECGPTEEFARAGAPLRAEFFGDTSWGQRSRSGGTDEQKRRFLPGILPGETTWCQGFSEPNSGSDLASLATRAVLDGDEWVINGQKVDNPGSAADYVFLLARTDPTEEARGDFVPARPDAAAQRRGAADTQVDGSGSSTRCASRVRCPEKNGVGGVGNGWKVANTTLAFERGARPPPATGAS